MDTNSGEATTISHLFSAEPAAAPAPVASATEQPLPPDVADGYNVPPPATEPAPVPPPQVQPEPQQQVQQPQTQMVPLAELISERRERQEYARRVQQLEDSMRRLSQPQPAPQPQIDPEVDPAGAFNALRSEFSTALLSQRLDFSEAKAREAHGDEAVNAAFEAARQAGFTQAFVGRPDAYGEMVRWHQAQQLQATIGSNPAAYTEQLKAQIRAQVLAELKQGTPPPSNLPPSLSTATRANPNATPEVMGSDKDFFRQTMNPRRG